MQLNRLWPILLALVILVAAIGVARYLTTQDADVDTLPTQIIQGYGQVTPLPKAAQQPKKGAKVVFDVTADAKPGEVNRGLDRVARLMNLYAATGLGERDVRVVLVMHGEATKSALLDKAYADRFEVKENPNLPLLRQLKEHGVEVYVCGQALRNKKMTDAEVSPEITIAVTAFMVLVNKQGEGYAYVPAP